jgi:hypothetical protein
MKLRSTSQTIDPELLGALWIYVIARSDHE